MPVMSCSSDGKSGYKYGESGHCYTHDGSEKSKKIARNKAAKQGRAIEISRHAKGEITLSFSELLKFYLEEKLDQISESN